MDSVCFWLHTELEERGAGGHYSSEYCAVSRREGTLSAYLSTLERTKNRLSL